MREFLFALRSGLGFLTTIPVGISMEGLAALGKRVYLFPVIGVLIGVLIGAIGHLLGLFLPSGIAAVGVIVSLYYLTGINHLDGLADFGDGVVAHGSREKKVSAMRDVSLGIGGVIFCVIIVIGLFTAVNEVLEGAMSSAGVVGSGAMGLAAGLNQGGSFLMVMLASEVCAKQAMLTISTFGKSSHPGLGSIMIDETGLREFGIGLVFSSAVCWVMLAEGGLLLLGSAIGVAFIVLRTANRNFGGISGDVIGATNEIARVVALLVAGVCGGCGM
ncbi:MAG: adenosylcobinamide-GDP ribazoletransferase [Methanosarcinales archaeon]|nr:MAG: adenosylcobinamide-GDP ribazoletransferase [Methanosarcinales archaeon]